ncbi:MAG: hypothetical protein FJY07_03960, partial [Bacteroidetes bacterium]|nr:hypothetical protein [Bacteroidota bacterium]
MWLKTILSGLLITAFLSGKGTSSGEPVVTAITGQPNPGLENAGVFDTCSNTFIYETWNNLDFVFSGMSFPVPLTEYFWDFGDGSYGSGQSATHSYTIGQGQTVFVVSLTTFLLDSLTTDTCV